MKTHLPKNAEPAQRQDKAEASFTEPVQNRAGAFVDARPVATAQRQVQMLAQQSPRTSQFKTLQAMLQSSPAQQRPPFQLKEGILAAGSDPLQLRKKTEITHEAEVYAGEVPGSGLPKELVGVKMHAQLVPGDFVLGSEPPKVNSKMYGALWKSNNIVRGHLLNHDLGGHGAPQNLFPITSGANSRHSKEVESFVKNELYTATAESTRAGADESKMEYVLYDVSVKKNSNKDSGFDCSWERKTEGGITQAAGAKSIASDFTVGTKGDLWAGSGAGRKTPGWAHGKGVKFDKTKFDKDVEKGKVKLEAVGKMAHDGKVPAADVQTEMALALQESFRGPLWELFARKIDDDSFWEEVDITLEEIATDVVYAYDEVDLEEPQNFLKAGLQILAEFGERLMPFIIEWGEREAPDE